MLGCSYRMACNTCVFYYYLLSVRRHTYSLTFSAGKLAKSVVISTLFYCRPPACMSTSSLVWHDTCRCIRTAERGLNVDFCGKQCVYRPTAGIRRSRSLLNRSRTGQGRYMTNFHKWGLVTADLCSLHLRSATDHEQHCRPVSSEKAWRRSLHGAGDDATGWRTWRLQHSR